MIYHLYWSRCPNCHQTHKWLNYEFFGYLLMANSLDKSDQRLLSFEDPTFNYVGKLAQQFKKDCLEIFKDDPHEIALTNFFNAGQHVFSMICDAVDGVRYYFGSPSDLPVRCPYCGNDDIPNWGPTEDPYETVDVEVPLITHTHFDALSEKEKEELILLETQRGFEYWKNILYTPNWIENELPRHNPPQPLVNFNVKS